MRKNKVDYYIGIAKAVAQRSTCIRRKYGTVIVKDDKIVGTGYNGSPRGGVNCCDIGCCKRESLQIPHGERYEECVATHSEQNAMFRSNWNDLQGSIMYLYGEENGNQITAIPCKICAGHIKNNGISVVFGSRVDGTTQRYNINLEEEK